MTYPDKKGHYQPSPLSPKQRRAALLLASGRTATDTAAEMKLARSTLERWKTMVPFIAEMNESKRLAIEDARDQLKRLTGKSVEELRRILDDPNARDGDKIQAIKLIFDRAFGPMESPTVQVNIQGENVLAISPLEAAKLAEAKRKVIEEEKA